MDAFSSLSSKKPRTTTGSSPLKPRERLLALGPKALHTYELFCILLGTGTKTRSVEVVAKTLAELLQKQSLATINVNTLLRIKGIGKAKACMVLAVWELASTPLTSPNAVAAFLHDMRESQKEMIVCLYLNARYTLEHKEVLAMGSLNQTLIYPRDVFLPIKQYPVSSLILVHNHPSGNPQPSEEDIVFTKRIRAGAELLGIELADHMILTKDDAFSFREHGMM